MGNTSYTIRYDAHIYITLYQDGNFVFCLDNDRMYAEEMIYRIEEKTGMDFQSIPIEGHKEDFKGLRFSNGGWKRDFWNKFPEKKEIMNYMKVTYNEGY